ncbi:Aste57867_16235 [Aphanomyces stellatus]|uniref:Aste57867_16235 protein n=1 Tax=Aphanomyces stellatus TaxID=120398 RepID=A0A485L6V7_9STRA|nr:hypothetical protein As57867_016178 [Aphanomyces stellatus]VFT93013.1 Aste57867_16235 [Aphanomyces stellatus]
MINVEKSAIVLDVGSRYLRCGMSGERSPRTVLRWEVAEKLQIRPPLSKEAWIQYVGNQLYDVCFKHLRVTPKNRRLVLCEDLLFPRNLREALVDVVYTVLKVTVRSRSLHLRIALPQAKQLLLLPSMPTALYATCHATALIVDAGWLETCILPVFERMPLLHAYTTTGLASRSCCAAIAAQFPDVASPEDILERACFASTADTPSTVRLRSSSVDTDIQTQDAHFFAMTPRAVTIPAATRAAIVETLFLGNDDHVSLPDAILDCIAKCPLDTRRALLSNVLCIGGTSMLPGFRARLVRALPSSAALVPTFFPSHLMAWVGASIYGSTEDALAHAVSAESYAAAPHVPDWMEVGVTP